MGTRKDIAGNREAYDRDLICRASDKLEEARTKLWTKIDATINEAKSCELDSNRYTEERRREQEFMYMEM